ncbi:MAG: hypothetical protein R2800_08430 [Flavipsychrobacter sp.]
MLKLITLILAGVFLTIGTVQAQYKIVDEVVTNDTIPASEDVTNMAYAIVGDTLFHGRKIADRKIVITGYRLSSGMSFYKDTIAGLPRSFRFIDISFSANNLLITDYNSYLSIALDKHRAPLYKGISPVREGAPVFRNCSFLSDSVALLYIVYNFHPKTRAAGLYLNLLNVNTNEFIKKEYFPFPGVSMAQVSRSWVTVANDKIYAVSPLSGVLFEFDKSLKLVGSKTMSLFDDKTREQNIGFEQYLDSSAVAYRQQVLSGNSEKEPQLAGIKSKTYSLIDTLSKSFTYIERIFPYNKDYIGVSVSNYEYDNKYKDFFVVDTHGNIIKEIKKWNYSVSPYITKPEELFPVDINREKNYFPYFQDGFIYTGSLYNYSLFLQGSVNDVTENIFKKTAQNGYVWSILKYKIEQ